MRIAIIPARGGSSRIPRKNIKYFLGKPIISYSIRAAIDSNLFDIVMVSTDDLEIAEISKQYGSDVPFLRGNENSNDTATMYQVIIEVLDKYKELDIEFDEVCCILATAPFVTPERLKHGYELFKNADSVRCEFRSGQDAGQFYFAKMKGLKKRNTIVGGKVKKYLFEDNEAHDINTMDDWEIAIKKFTHTWEDITMTSKKVN